MEAPYVEWSQVEVETPTTTEYGTAHQAWLAIQTSNAFAKAKETGLPVVISSGEFRSNTNYSIAMPDGRKMTAWASETYDGSPTLTLEFDYSLEEVKKAIKAYNS
jgi:hypothetical protein